MATDFEPEVLSDLPIPPGEILKEEIEYIGMTEQELAKGMGLSPQAVQEIIQGKRAITHDTAVELERALGIPAELWTNLEAIYQLTQARLKERDALLAQRDGNDSSP